MVVSKSIPATIIALDPGTQETIKDNLKTLGKVKLLSTGPEELRQANYLLIKMICAYDEICQKYGLKII